jgi:hypothetical protein
MKPTFLLLSFFFLFTTQVAFAQNEVIVNTDRIEDGFIKEEFGFIPCNGPDCSTCHLVALVNTIVKWLIGIVFIFFAIIAVYAGFQMVMSGGNSGALSDAKEKFTNAFIGLIIVLAAWLMVDTLMRGLLDNSNGTIENYGPWSNVQCVGQYVPDILPGQWPGDPDTPTGATSTPSGPRPAGCTGGSCVKLTIPCSNPSSCSISPDLVAKFATLHATANVSGARVTEAMPPTRTHKSVCHTNGTCIDYSKQGGMTPAEVLAVVNAANSVGFTATYEVKTQAEKNRLVSAGVPSGSVLVLGNWISASHFSIYGYKK